MTDVSEFRAVPAAVPQAILSLGRLSQQEFASVSGLEGGLLPGKREEKSSPSRRTRPWGAAERSIAGLRRPAPSVR